MIYLTLSEDKWVEEHIIVWLFLFIFRIICVGTDAKVAAF
jgi:hypothetical protein